ncbi:MAG: hypothetical protein R2729_25125 [Bryobacteraceae bacterium]
MLELVVAGEGGNGEEASAHAGRSGRASEARDAASQRIWPDVLGSPFERWVSAASRAATRAPNSASPRNLLLAEGRGPPGLLVLDEIAGRRGGGLHAQGGALSEEEERAMAGFMRKRAKVSCD